MPGTDIERKNVPQEQLVADIEQTRAELASTIDEITNRLNPANAARRTVERVRDRVTETDPVMAGGAAVVVAGVVVAYLLLRGRRRRRS
jgi:hypothetical protein